MIVRNFLCVFMTIFLSKRVRQFRKQSILIDSYYYGLREDVPDTVIQSGAILKNCDLTYQYGAQNDL